MKSVFEASTVVEAYMVKNLLEINDIPSEILGEHLQGGIGELPATGVIRVMVSGDDYDEACRIISDWETVQPQTIDDAENNKKSGFGRILLSFILGAIAVLLLTKTPIKQQGIDYDNDGAFDEEWRYIDGLLSSAKLDQNRDGEFDTVWKYDLKGLLKSSLFDQDFDGRYETKCRLRDGNNERCLSDYDNDGFSEYRESYKYGVLSTISFFHIESKALKKKIYLEGGVLKSAEIDLDDDGVLETIYEYDDYEEIKSVRRMPLDSVVSP